MAYEPDRGDDGFNVRAGNSGLGRALVATAALALAGAAAGTMIARRRHHEDFERIPDDAPEQASRRGPWFQRHSIAGSVVTIDRPRSEIYAFWRDFENLTKVMENIHSVRRMGDRWLWTISAPMGRRVEIETEITEDRPDETIAWRSVEGSQVETTGRVTFRDHPAGRGTCVEAIVTYHLPAGELGRMIAKLFQEEPSVQSRRDLKRLKMLLETGEIATSQNRRNAA